MKRLLLPTALFLSLGALLRAAPLSVGDAGPAVTGTAETGKPLDLAATYKANKYTLVYFYPKAFTSGCTTQGCALRDSYDELTKQGVTVVGVSVDDVATQKKFHDEYKFPFPLIADTDKKVVKAFGQAGLSMASRESYLINQEGKVVYHDTNQTASQATQVLNFLSRQAGAPAPAAPAAKPADAKPAAAPAAPAAK